MESALPFSRFFWAFFAGEFKLNKALNDLPTTKPKSLFDNEHGEDNLMQITQSKLTLWSPDNAELYEKIVAKGFMSDFLNKQFLRNFYKALRLESRKITEFDADFQTFSELQEAIFNHNKISTVENLPINLQELHLYGNRITSLKLTAKYEKLVFLGLAHNYLTDNCLEGLASKVPNLLSLDLAYNQIGQLDTTIDQLTLYKKLKHSNFFGNPIAVIPEYRKALLDVLKNLKFLDNISTFEELNPPPPKKKEVVVEEQPDPKAKDSKKGAKKEEQKKDNKGKGGKAPPQKKDTKLDTKKTIETETKEDLDISTHSIAEFTKLGEGASVKLVVHIATLENVDGFNLDAEFNPNGDKPTQLFQTSYWIKFNAFGTEYQSEPVLFQSATVEDEKARIEFEFKNEIKMEKIDQEVFKEGLIIELYRNQPKLEPTENPDDKKIEMTNGEPILVTSLIGACRIDLKEFLEPKPKKKQVQSFKYPLYGPEILKVPELYVPDKNEKKYVELHNAEEERKRQELLKQEEEANTVDKKKGGKAAPVKKEVKKDNKKAAKKGGKNEVTEVKQVQLLNWQALDRTQIYSAQNNKVLDALPYLLAVHTAVVIK